MAIIELVIIGAIASLIVETIKGAFGTDTLKTKAITISVSLVLGSLVFFLRNEGWLESSFEILTVASTVYAFLLKKR